MTANVEIMIYVREKPWHGLGTRGDEAVSSKDALQLSGLDWKVVQTPIYTSSGEAIAGYKANVRDSNNKVLDAVTGRNKVIQNSEEFELSNGLMLIAIYSAKVMLPKDMVFILITMFRAVILMKKATERRRNILDLLIKSHEPISTTYLVEIFQVTKPVVDEDIRILKDAGYNIVGTPGHHGGYQLYDYEGATKMVLDSERAKRFEDICGRLPEDEKHILSYVMHLAELGNIV